MVRSGSSWSAAGWRAVTPPSWSFDQGEGQARPTAVSAASFAPAPRAECAREHRQREQPGRRTAEVEQGPVGAEARQESHLLPGGGHAVEEGGVGLQGVAVWQQID